MTAWPFAVVTGVALLGLLVAQARGWRPGVWIFKPIASTGFLLVAIAAGAAANPYGQLLLAALALSWLGDLLLIPRGEKAFLAGLGSFLLGHVAFAAGFALRGADLRWAGLSLLLLVPAAIWVHRLLAPHLGRMRGPVLAYMTAITAMVALAAGTFARAPDARLLAGALAFYASDLSVARNQFVERAFVNQLWGLPLYYGGQVLLALTAGG